MKKQLLYAFISLITFSCNNNNDAAPAGAGKNESGGSNTSKNASFTVDGKTYKGNVRTQYFGDKATGAFSVLCQQDEPLALLQAVFANESDPATHENLNPRESYFSMNPGDVHLSLSGEAIGPNEFVSSGYNDGTIRVKDHVLIIDKFKLYSKVDGEKTVSSSIPF